MHRQRVVAIRIDRLGTWREIGTDVQSGPRVWAPTGGMNPTPVQRTSIQSVVSFALMQFLSWSSLIATTGVYNWVSTDLRALWDFCSAYWSLTPKPSKLIMMGHILELVLGFKRQNWFIKPLLLILQNFKKWRKIFHHIHFGGSQEGCWLTTPQNYRHK